MEVAEFPSVSVALTVDSAVAASTASAVALTTSAVALEDLTTARPTAALIVSTALEVVSVALIEASALPIAMVEVSVDPLVVATKEELANQKRTQGRTDQSALSVALC